MKKYFLSFSRKYLLHEQIYTKTYQKVLAILRAKWPKE